MLAEGSTVAVFGCGAIGLGVIATSALVGASRIIAVDTNPGKDSWAKKFGATEFVNPSKLKEGEKIQDYLIQITDGGLDYTFDCTGNVCFDFSMSTSLDLFNYPLGSCHACCLGSLSQRLGCLHHYWSGCCGARDFHSTVSILHSSKRCCSISLIFRFQLVSYSLQMLEAFSRRRLIYNMIGHWTNLAWDCLRRCQRTY